jgi:hypothetical protein
MPTVFRFDGLRVVIYPADQRPEHVHVEGAGGEAVFILNCLLDHRNCGIFTDSAGTKRAG